MYLTILFLYDTFLLHVAHNAVLSLHLFGICELPETSRQCSRVPRELGILLIDTQLLIEQQQVNKDIFFTLRGKNPRVKMATVVIG